MHITLNKFNFQNCLLYLYDVIVFSRSSENHTKDLKDIITVLKASILHWSRINSLYLSTPSITWAQTITSAKLSVSSETVKALRGFCDPRTKTKVRPFLSFYNVYQRLVLIFSRVASPQNKLLNKYQPLNLEPLKEDQYRPFDTLNMSLVNSPLLALSRRNFPYSIDKYACKIKLDCALIHTNEYGMRYSIGYWSRSLLDA